MLPGIDTKKMNALMKQMGVSQEEIEASRVVIECPGKNIIISDPTVLKIKMQGQINFQVSGSLSTETIADDEKDTEEDIKTIIERTGCSEEQARRAYRDSGSDLAEAILNLS